MADIEISKKLVMINTASSSVILVLNLSVLIWLQQFLLKRVSPDEYALLPLITAALAFAPLITTILTGGLGRYQTVAYFRDDSEEITRICSTMFPILLTGGCILLAIGWFSAWHIDKFFDIKPEYLSDARLMMALLILPIAIRIPLAAFGSGFIIRQKLMFQDMIDVGCQLIRIGILFALLFGADAKVLWVTVALVASELLNLAISTPISVRLVPAQKLRTGMFSKTLARALISFGSWSFVDGAAGALKVALDPIILNRFATSMDVALFHLAGIVPRQLLLMLTPISRPFIPIFAAIYGLNDQAKLRNTYLRVARYHTWVLMLFIVPGIIFSNEIIHFYLGDTYSSASVIMAILLLNCGLAGLNGLGGTLVAATGHLKQLSLRRLFAQVINLIITLFLVTVFQLGALGSATATLAATILVEVSLVWPYCRKVAGVKAGIWLKEVVIPGIIPAIALAFICIVGLKVFHIDGWLKLILVCFFGGVSYLIVLLLFCLRLQDRLDIDRLADRAPRGLKLLLHSIARI